MKNKIRQIRTYDMFEGFELNPQYLFVNIFNTYPSGKEILSLDTVKAITWIKENYASDIQGFYEFSGYSHSKKRFVIDDTLIVLRQGIVLDFFPNKVDIYHKTCAENHVLELSKVLSKMKVRAKKEPAEIKIILRNRSGFELKSMELKRSKLDLDLYYEDELIELDKVIQARLRKPKDKGIVLLHGLPGTGKTSYLRYLISKVKKQVIFLPSDSADEISRPEFTELLMRNQDSVLVIEDAENVITDRALNSRNSVAALLNLSDGLMSDFMNIQIICTFNKPLTMVDSALLRKGRLIARYEFDKLGINKAQRLSDHLGMNRTINEPLTLAEITNPAEISDKFVKPIVIGFRSNILE